MIEYIKGEVTDITPAYAVLETCGVGYMLNISLITYSEIKDQGAVRLYVYEALREDAHTLYGFHTREERDLFMLLISVSGVGASTARMILSSFSVAELQEVIATGNTNALKNVKGIGLKSAQRIIVDLKDKVGKAIGEQLIAGVAAAADGRKDEAVAALVMLGFQQSQSAKAVDKLLKEEPTLEVAKLIKRALQML